jgi:hypothetical protein
MNIKLVSTKQKENYEKQQMNVNGISGKRKQTIFKSKLFSFSENYIFGKFDTFCRRLDRIVDVLNTIESLSGLQNIRVEGLEPIVVKYRSVVDAIKKKSYDLLDHRKPDVNKNKFLEFL